MNTPNRQQVTNPLVTLAHNANVSQVALYGEMLSEQERKLQMFAAQLGASQQQCAQLTESIKSKDAQIQVLQNQVVNLTNMLPKDEPEEPPPVVGLGG